MLFYTVLLLLLLTFNIIGFSQSADSILSVDMVLVEEGSFIMGTEEGKPDEKPAHRVTLSAYYIRKFEITQE